MIGIIGAMDVEINNLINAIENKKKTVIGGFSFFEGVIDKQKVVVLKSGIGKVAAAVGASLMIEHFKPDFIINTGIAGGINGVKSEDLVLAKMLNYGDVDVTVFGYSLGQVPQMPEYYTPDSDAFKKLESAIDEEYKYGQVVTFDSFVTTLKNKKLNIKMDVAVSDMEGCAIAQACYMLKTPFVSLKFVSDIVDEPGQIENYSEFERNMAYKSSEIVLGLINKIKE